MYRLVCIGCGTEYSPDDIIYRCRECGHLLAVKYDLGELNISRAEWNRRPLKLWRYRELLPVTGDPISLQEGGTSLSYEETW